MFQKNTGVLRGRWGEDVAAKWLVRNGYAIAARNVRPCLDDKRLEIDIVARDRRNDIVVFVEVKQHASRDGVQTRLRAVDSRKKALLLRACRAWMWRKRWRGSFRFDVIEVYGTPESRLKPEIDHVERVRLFTSAQKHVDWS